MMADENECLNGNKRDMAGLGADFPNSKGRFFEIRVKGQLDSCWSDWLEGMEVRLLENGDMILFGPIVDQAALMGVLNKLNRLNLTLLSLTEVKKKD